MEYIKSMENLRLLQLNIYELAHSDKKTVGKFFGVSSCKSRRVSCKKQKKSGRTAHNIAFSPSPKKRFCNLGMTYTMTKSNQPSKRALAEILIISLSLIKRWQETSFFS